MEIKGKLIKIMPVQTGQGKNGEWKKQDIVLETEGTYPKKVCISVWGDKINVSSLAIGNMLNASIDIESREFNDKWYTNVTAWKIDVVSNEQPMPSMPPIDAYSADADLSSSVQDDLPF